MFIFIGLIIFVICLALSAFWSASEIALNSLSRYRVKKLIVLKKSIAKPLLKWLQSPYYLLTVILTGNVISDMLVSFVSTSLSVQIFPEVNRIILEFFTWLIATYLVLVIGEITPKIYSRTNSQKVTLLTVPVLSKIEVISKPFLFPVYKIFDMVFSNGSDLSADSVLSKDEVKNLISETEKEGVFDKEISGMLERSAFFTEIPAAKIMTPFKDIESVDINEKEEKFIDMVVETARSRVPVYDGQKQNIIGYIHINDVLWIWKQNNGKFTKKCIKPAYFIAPDTKISELLKELQSGRTHIAFVKNDKGNIVGMVTLEDIVEEIVGDILDEYDDDGI